MAQDCKASVDGWCETHSTDDGPVWCVDALKDALRRARFHERENYDRWKTLEALKLGTLSNAERCHRCKGENVTWCAPSPLWNRVMRGNDINGEPIHGDLVCVRCFIVLATEAGITGQWRISVSPEPDGLIYETPSGRIWDADSWLWTDSEARP